ICHLPRRPSFPTRRSSDLLLALILGSAGGWLASSINLPLPWMIGSMLATTIASMVGAPIAMAAGLRTLMVMVLGVMLGSGFTPRSEEHTSELQSRENLVCR